MKKSVKITLVDFVKKNESDKVRDYSQFTGKYRGPVRSKCNSNVIQDQGNFITFVLHNLSKFDCHLFF